jgi:FkbM family methyltransferase
MVLLVQTVICTAMARNLTITHRGQRPMGNGPEFTETLFKGAIALPAVGYPLLLSWQKGWIRPPTGISEVRLKDQRTLRCDLGDSTQRTMALGLFEPAETRLVTELLQPGDTFVDVGAHIGWFTTIASRRVGPDGAVIACEPYPANAAALKENLALNHARNVRLVEMALGSQPGELSLAPAGDSGGITALDWGQGERVTASMTTLDEVVAEAPAVTLLKMDVEGWEPHVLRGGGETLRRTERVLIEINKPALTKAGSSPEEIYGLLRDAGFTDFSPIASRGVRRLLPQDQVFNVLAGR